MVLGLSAAEKEQKKMLLAGLAQAEAPRVQAENEKLASLSAKITSLDNDFKALSEEEKQVIKLKKLLHHAQEIKMKLLQKDMRLRRRMKVGMDDHHYNRSLRKERRFAKRRKKMVMKEAKELQKLHHELAALHQYTLNLEHDEATLYDDYAEFLKILGLESFELKRALRKV